MLGKPITGFIQEMIRIKIDRNCLVENMPRIIIDYFNSLPVVPDTNFIIAGYDTVEKNSKYYIKLMLSQKILKKLIAKDKALLGMGRLLRLQG